MSDALRAAKQHLQELAANQVPARDRPSALHHGLLTTLVADFERVLVSSGGPLQIPHACEQCGKENGKTGRFCSDKCRSTWHREHDPRGIVKSVRRLHSGATSVGVHFPDPDAERALHLNIGQAVVLGAIQ